MVLPDIYDSDRVLAAVQQARKYAAAHGEPVTLTTVAMHLGVGDLTLLRIAESNNVGESKHDKTIIALLKAVYRESKNNLPKGI